MNISNRTFSTCYHSQDSFNLHLHHQNVYLLLHISLLLPVHPPLWYIPEPNHAKPACLLLPLVVPSMSFPNIFLSKTLLCMFSGLHFIPLSLMQSYIISYFITNFIHNSNISGANLGNFSMWKEVDQTPYGFLHATKRASHHLGWLSFFSYFPRLALGWLHFWIESFHSLD